MTLISIEVERPKQKQDCIVLTAEGKVTRAIADKTWVGGFCEGDGESGCCVQNVTHWIEFKYPNSLIKS